MDCPDLAMGRHTRHAHLTDEEFCEVAAANVEAMNLALRLANVPAEQVRYHVCWGNFRVRVGVRVRVGARVRKP